MQDSLDAYKWLKKFSGFPFYPASNEAIVARAEAIAAFVNNETFDHPELGKVNDLDWVMGRLLAESTQCPLPVDVFRLHSEKFPSWEEKKRSE